MEPEDILANLETEVETVETDLEQLQDDRVPQTTREKQQRAEELLEEIQGQLEFLRQQVNRGKS